MAHAQAAFGDFVLALRAYVYEQLFQLRRLLVAVARAQVNGRVAHDTLHRPLVAEQNHTLAACDGMIGAADAVHTEKSLVCDVLHHEPDLVGVGLEHDGRRLGIRAFQRCPCIAVSICLHGIGVVLHVPGPHALALCFKARWAGGVEQFEEKGAVGFGHVGFWLWVSEVSRD